MNLPQRGIHLEPVKFNGRQIQHNAQQRQKNAQTKMPALLAQAHTGTQEAHDIRKAERGKRNAHQSQAGNDAIRIRIPEAREEMARKSPVGDADDVNHAEYKIGNGNPEMLAMPYGTCDAHQHKSGEDVLWRKPAKRQGDYIPNTLTH